MIKAIHQQSRQNYGSPRVFKELQARGEPCNVKTVARIMRENDIVAKRRRKFKHTDLGHDDATLYRNPKVKTTIYRAINRYF